MQGLEGMLIRKNVLLITLVGTGKLVCNSKYALRGDMSEQYKSCNLTARSRYLAKLQVVGLKDDSFAVWNNSNFKIYVSVFVQR